MSKVTRLLSILVSLSVLLAVLPGSSAPVYTYVDVNVSEAEQMIESAFDLIILDVRTQGEYESGHIEEAVLIPVDELEARLDELNKHQETLVYCGSGGRSAQACEILATNGFRAVYNLLGGITGWREAGYPVTSAQSFFTTFFGPEVFVRGTGKPVVEIREFSAAGFQPPFTLHLQNGENDGKHRVSSALVWLNGEQLFGPSNFSQQVSGYAVEVTLERENRLEVELRSKPGSKLEIWIEGIGAEACAVAGPEGGVVEVTNPESPIYGLILDIPAGALQELTVICVDDLPKSRVDTILSARSFTSAQKHMLGGFIAEPDGLVFDIPITASVPVEPLSTDGGVPVQAKVLLDEEVYWLEPTDLIYDPDAGKVEMVLQDLSGHAVVELEEFLVPPEERLAEVVQPSDTCPCNQALEEAFVPLEGEIPCKQLRMHVESSMEDFARGTGCHIVSDTVWVTFLDCPGKPKIPASIREATPECGLDFSLKVEVDPPSALLFPCTTEALKARVWDHTGKELTEELPIWWFNTNEPDGGAVEVSQSGIVRGLRDGKTLILAVSPDPRYYNETEITVIGYVCSVDMDPPSGAIFPGEKLPLTAKPKDVDGNTPPKDRFGNDVEGLTATWRSTDDDIATVDSNGVVTGGESPGTVKIGATVEGVEGFASITVKEPGRVVIFPSSVTISVGDTQHFTVTVYDADDEELPGYPVEWIIPPSEAIAFDAVTQTVTGVSPGTAVIWATGEGAAASATIIVEEDGVVEVGSVVIDPEEATIPVWVTLYLEVTVYDKNGNELPDYPVEWMIPPGEGESFLWDPVAQTVTGLKETVVTIGARAGGTIGWTIITVNPRIAYYRYKLTWIATIEDTVTFKRPDYFVVQPYDKTELSAVFAGYAVIEEVPDPPSVWERNKITDFSTSGHYECYSEVLVEVWPYGGLYEIYSGQGSYDITGNGMETVKRFIEMYFGVVGTQYASMECFRILFMKYPLDSWIEALLTTDLGSEISAFPTMGRPGDALYDATTKTFRIETNALAWKEASPYDPFPTAEMYAHWVIEVEVLGVVS